MSSPSSRLALGEATPEDAGQLLEILESRPMPGAVSLVYTRRPDAYASMQREGERVGIIVGRDRTGERVLAMGAWAIRTLYVNGAPEQVAYLFGLRARGDALKSWPVLPRGYARLGERLQELGVRWAVTTIVESNRRVAAMLGRPRPFMPAYRSIGRYEVFALLPSRRRPIPAPRVRVAVTGDAGRIAEFLDDAGRRQQFFPRVRPADLIAGRGVPPIGSVRWLEGRRGEVLAAGALWDQSDYRQYRVHRYGRSIQWMRRVGRLAPFLGLPRLPEPGRELRYATLALWAARDDDPALLRDLLVGLEPSMVGYTVVLAGAHAAHPMREVFRQRRHVSYGSEAFLVSWDGAPEPLDSRPIYLECGTL